MFAQVMRYKFLSLILIVLCGLEDSRQVSYNRVHETDAISSEKSVKPFPLTPMQTSVWKALIKAIDGPETNDSKGFDVGNRLYQECGIANFFQTAQETNGMKITGGELTLPHQYPWQVLVTDRADTFLCGGSVISDRWIVTVAHCVDGLEEVLIVLGAHNLTSYTKPPGQTSQTSRDIFIHPKWNGTSIANDIALIKLPRNITFSYYVRPICLPSYNDTSSHAKEHVTLTGWGRFSDESEATSDVLLSTNATVITNQECSGYYPRYITNNMICVVGEKNEGTCSGDSGGPMNYYDQTTGKWTLAGLVSFGSSAGCEKGYPSVFTRVRSYLEWIDRSVQQGNDSSRPRFSESLILFWCLGFFLKMTSKLTV